MWLRAGALAVTLALISLPGEVARADPLTGRLHVERAAGAEACPDAEALRAEVEALAGSKILSGPDPRDVTIDLRVAPAPKGGFEAIILLSGKRAGERRLEDVGPGCDVLARGLTVTLAILLEAGPGAPVLPVPPPPKAALPAIPWWRRYYLMPAIEAPKPVASEYEGIPPIVASLGAIYDSATLISDTGGVALGVDGYIPYASFGVEFVWLPREELDRGFFQVTYAYAAGRTRACVRDPFIEQFGLAACARFVAGRRTANLESTRKVELDQDHGAYLALGPQVEISRRVVGPVGLYANLGIDFPVLQDELTVRDPVAGVAFRVPEQVVSFETGVGVRFWLEPPKKTAR